MCARLILIMMLFCRHFKNTGFKNASFFPTTTERQPPWEKRAHVYGLGSKMVVALWDSSKDGRTMSIHLHRRLRFTLRFHRADSKLHVVPAFIRSLSVYGVARCELVWLVKAHSVLQMWSALVERKNCSLPALCRHCVHRRLTWRRRRTAPWSSVSADVVANWIWRAVSPPPGHCKEKKMTRAKHFMSAQVCESPASPCGSQIQSDDSLWEEIFAQRQSEVVHCRHRSGGAAVIFLVLLLLLLQLFAHVHQGLCHGREPTGATSSIRHPSWVMARMLGIFFFSF